VGACEIGEFGTVLGDQFSVGAEQQIRTGVEQVGDDRGVAPDPGQAGQDGPQGRDQRE
jgi:hypothetical protein